MTLGGSEAGPGPDGRAGTRAAALRLARLHLRGGAHALARAELEAEAGADRLDRDAVADLAEVRWRTGDLAGAQAAALAWLEDGDGEPRATALVHVICAEAAATAGRDDEAALHVDAAAAHLADPSALGALLAGIRPRAAWPGPAGDAAGGDRSPATDAGIGPAALAASTAAAAAAPELAPPAAPAPPAPLAGGIPVAPAAAELAAAGSGLLAAAPERAAVLLALALRADRAAAAGVLATLDAAGPAMGTVAALAFVRAEALRAAGRHEEARIAYASAERLALAPAEAGTPRSIP